MWFVLPRLLIEIHETLTSRMGVFKAAEAHGAALPLYY